MADLRDRNFESKAARVRVSPQWDCTAEGHPTTANHTQQFSVSIWMMLCISFSAIKDARKSSHICTLVRPTSQLAKSSLFSSIDRQGRANTFSPPSSPSHSPAADRRMHRYGILATRKNQCSGHARVPTEDVRTYHILVCKLADLARLDPEILEGLCLLINHLVNVFHLNLLCRQRGPPEHLVQDPRSGLENPARHIDVSPRVKDLPVYHIGDVGSGVLLGPIELVGLPRRGVVVEHQLKSVADVNRLEQSQSR